MGFDQIEDRDISRLFFDAGIQFSPKSFGLLTQSALANIGIKAPSVFNSRTRALLNQGAAEDKEGLITGLVKARVNFFRERAKTDEQTRRELKGRLKRARRR